jgi:hypothetical protein
MTSILFTPHMAGPSCDSSLYISLLGSNTVRAYFKQKNCGENSAEMESKRKRNLGYSKWNSLWSKEDKECKKGDQ